MKGFWLSVCSASAVLLGNGPVLSQPLPRSGGVYVVTIIQTRPDRVGDRYSYVAETHTTTTQKGAAQERGDRQAFDLEIEKVTPDARTVRYVQTSADLVGPTEARTAAYLKAWNGVPVEFETAPNGYPLRVVNEAEIKAAVLRNVARELPDDRQIGAMVERSLNQVSPEEFADNLVGDKLAMLAVMQFRGPRKIGPSTLPTETHQDADGGAVLVKAT